MKTLTEIFASSGITFETYEGRAELKKFADKYPNECVLQSDSDVVLFGTATESFEIRADLNEELETVFCGRIITHCPQRVVFDTDYHNTVDDVVQKLAVGAQTVYPQRAHKVKNKTSDNIARISAKKEKGKEVTPHMAFHTLRNKCKIAAENKFDESYLTDIALYYEKRRALLAPKLPDHINTAMDAAIANSTDSALMIEAAVECIKHFGYVVE